MAVRSSSISMLCGFTTTVSADKLAAIRTTMDHVADATAGAIQVTFVQTSNSDPIPSRNQVTSTTTENAGALGCASNNGCTIHTFVNPSSPGLFLSSRALQPASQSPNAYAHDPIGHGVIGLCHPDGDLIGGASLSLMS